MKSASPRVRRARFAAHDPLLICHPREGGDQLFVRFRFAAFAGMTVGKRGGRDFPAPFLYPPPAMTLAHEAKPHSSIATQVAKRRTFAIISHPDAGKTTLTEHLLLLGGAIHAAGRVKARGEARRAKSDWMKIEQERGISVTSAVMTFEYENAVFNLLDTPGHEDFSEDTYRTLTAADSAVMVIDAAKGIEAQTRKLFEVCRLRDIPITTFVNKMDREARDPFELLDEISDQLQIETAPLVWPAGMGQNFKGVFDLVRDSFLSFPGGKMTEDLQGRLDEESALV